MQSTLLEEKETALDAANIAHLRAAEACLAQNDLPGACIELLKIQRRVAGNPAVIQLRRRLVAKSLGLEAD